MLILYPPTPLFCLFLLWTSHIYFVECVAQRAQHLLWSRFNHWCLFQYRVGVFLERCILSCISFVTEYAGACDNRPQAKVVLYSGLWCGSSLLGNVKRCSWGGWSKSGGSEMWRNSHETLKKGIWDGCAYSASSEMGGGGGVIHMKLKIRGVVWSGGIIHIVMWLDF